MGDHSVLFECQDVSIPAVSIAVNQLESEISLHSLTQVNILWVLKEDLVSVLHVAISILVNSYVSIFSSVCPPRVFDDPVSFGIIANHNNVMVCAGDVK